MKISARDTASALKNPGARFRALLLFGPDEGLARERAQQVKASVLADGGDPFAFVELSESTLLADPARLESEVRAIGLLSSKRLVLLRDAGDKAMAAIENAAAHFHEDVFVLVTAGELPPRSSLRAWFESSAVAAAIGCYPDEARDIEAIVRETFSGAGIAAGREVVEYLCSQLGNDREVTRSELEKILVYAGEDKSVTLEDARALVDYNRETALDDVVNAAADRQPVALDRLLAVCAREGMAPIAYLRALQRYFNRLYYVKSKAIAGGDIESVVQNLKPKVFYKQAPLMVRHARNWSQEQILRALKLLVAAELACKTSDVPAFAASSRRLFQLAQMR